MAMSTRTAPDDVPYADPYHCPLCHSLLVDAGDGTARCPRCRFDATHPLAADIWRIDCEQARLAAERRELIESLRRDLSLREPVVVPEPTAGRPPSPRGPAPSRKVSVQALLVGLGAFLLVVAGVVFAAVTWDRLGAAGQAVVLAVATATAAAVTLVAARRGLTATAEALSVVAAGFALVDVQAARVALAPDGPWQPVWAGGLVLVAIGLLVLGRSARVRAPAIVAVGAAQFPLVILSTMAGPGPIGAAAVVATAAADHLAVPRLRRSPTRWLPEPTLPWLRVLGAAAWTFGAVAALPWAIGAADTAATATQWWGVVVLAAAAALAAVVAGTGGPARRYPVAAAAGGVVVGLTAIVASAVTLGLAGEAVLLVATAAPLGVLGTVVAAGDRWVEDARSRAAAVAAAVWAAATAVGWLAPVVSALAAPFLAVADDGWWTRTAGVTTGDLGAPLDADLERWMAMAIAAVPIIGVNAVLAAASLLRPRRAVRNTAAGLVAGAAGFVVVAIGGVLWDMPVWTLVAVNLAGAAALVSVSARPGRTAGPWPALGAVPPAVVALAWAGSVELLTCLAVGALTVVGGVAVAVGVSGDRRRWTGAATAVTGVGLAATGWVVAAAVGADAPGAWLTALVVASVASSVAFAAERRVPWWTTAVDLMSGACALGALAGLVAVAGPDPISVGLGVVAVAAAVHVLRPSRRVVAAVVAATAALALLWLRLWVGDVRAVEAYTLPLAALLLLAGMRRLRNVPEEGSWPALGPGLLVAALPSAVVAVDGNDVARPLVVLGVAVAVTIAGASTRLRAPLLVGAVTAVVMAVDQVFPVVAQLPRWLTIGSLGVVLLVVGATFERRRQQATQLYRKYRTLR